MYIEEIIKLMQKQDKSGKLDEHTFVGGLCYRVHCSVKFWKNPFTRKSGHRISIILDHDDVAVQKLNLEMKYEN